VLTIPHPALEALFTIDEETGMTGAMGLQPGLLKGDILLNLDTEEDDEIGVGCAGGIDVTATRSYSEEPTPQTAVAFDLSVEGLQGGHSGMDIHKGFGNANKLLSRLCVTMVLIDLDCVLHALMVEVYVMLFHERAVLLWWSM